MLPIVLFRKGPVPQRRDNNATHSLFIVRIWEQLPFMLPILAQEIDEEWFLTRWFRLPAGVVALAGAGLAGFTAVSLYLAFVFFLIVPFIAKALFKGLHREMEYRGHIIEWRAASDMIERGMIDYERFPQLAGLTSDGYLLGEAMALANYDQFEGVGRDEIVEQLNKRREFARKWVDRHFDGIVRRYGKRSVIEFK